jgi:hypothetical protein
MKEPWSRTVKPVREVVHEKINGLLTRWASVKTGAYLRDAAGLAESQNPVKFSSVLLRVRKMDLP